jgi:plasmid stabilization system protein ParE
MRRYIIAPKAAEDLKEIRAYLKREAGLRVAQSTLNKIKDTFLFLSRNPGAGHVREDLTDEPVKFCPSFRISSSTTQRRGLLKLRVSFTAAARFPPF